MVKMMHNTEFPWPQPECLHLSGISEYTSMKYSQSAEHE